MTKFMMITLRLRNELLIRLTEIMSARKNMVDADDVLQSLRIVLLFCTCRRYFVEYYRKTYLSRPKHFEADWRYKSVFNKVQLSFSNIHASLWTCCDNIQIYTYSYWDLFCWRISEGITRVSDVRSKSSGHF